MKPDSVLLVIKILFSVAALVAVFIYAVRPLIRMWREKPDMDLISPDYSQMLEGEELEIPTEQESGKPDRTKLIAQLREDPHTAALMVSQWLRERK